MILKGKIKNKEEILELFLNIQLKENPDQVPKIKGNFLKSLSCPLCFRFLLLPKKHQQCGQRFCEACISKWIELFPFCPKCLLDISPFQLDKLPLDEDFNSLTRKIKIKCELGKCAKEEEESKPGALKGMPVILEREIAEEASSQEEEEEERNFFWNWFDRRKSKVSLQNSDIMSIDNSNLNNSDLNSINRTSSSIFNSMESSSILSSDIKNKRIFSVNDYILHLVRKHSWPLMQITQDKNKRKISFVGFKKEKHLKQEQNIKLGPGVIHTVGEDREIKSLVGIYLNNVLKRNVRIYKGLRLVFEGRLVNGCYENVGQLKHYLKIDTGEKEIKGILEYQGVFKHGKPDGKGRLSFIGDYEEMMIYFQEKENFGILRSGLNPDFFQSRDTHSVLDEFFAQYSKLSFYISTVAHRKGIGK